MSVYIYYTTIHKFICKSTTKKRRKMKKRDERFDPWGRVRERYSHVPDLETRPPAPPAASRVSPRPPQPPPSAATTEPSPSSSPPPLSPAPCSSSVAPLPLPPPPSRSLPLSPLIIQLKSQSVKDLIVIYFLSFFVLSVRVWWYLINRRFCVALACPGSMYLFLFYFSPLF